MTDRTVLRCGTLIDGSGVAARRDVALVVEGARIAALEPWDERTTTTHEPEPHRDLRRHTVVPGLIDAHAHLCLGAAGSAGWARAAADPVGIVAWGLAAGIAALRTGITTVVDVGSPQGLALRAARLIDAGLAAGPQVLAAGPAITTTAGHGAEFGVAADSASELVGAVRGAVADGADLIKIMVTGGAVDPWTNRRRAQYTEEQLRAGIEDAHRLGRKVVGHANATEGITRGVRAGIDVIAHCNWLGTEPGTVRVELDTVDEMARRGTWVDLNIQGALRDLRETDGAVATWPGPGAVPSTRWELLRSLRDKGLRLYLTSDAFGPAIGGFAGSLAHARGRWDLSAEELIRLVSGAPAEALGMEDRGILAAGRLADLVVLDGDLVSDPGTLLRPLSVHRSGLEVVAHGRLSPPAAALGAGTEAAAQQDLLDAVFKVLA